MELYPACVTCVIDNVMHMAEKVLPDVEDRMTLLRRMMQRFTSEVRCGSCAPLLTGIGYDILREMSGIDDPYEDVKKKFNDLMLASEDRYRDLVNSSDDSLQASLVVAGAANLIDFGAFQDISEEAVLGALSAEVERTELPKDIYGAFLDELDRHRRLLVLGDNCGEIVLDKIVADQLKARFPGIEITYAVRGRPILNDSTLEDAHSVGLDDLVSVVSSGSDLSGFVPERCGEDFRRIYDGSPVVLAKGVGNFEGADFGDSRLFFLFMIKCRTLSELMDVPLRTLVFRQGRNTLL